MAPRAMALPTRFTLPPEMSPDDKVIREMVNWSFYSCFALNAAALPRDGELFNYLVGQTVAGAGTGAIAATRYHTNMEAVRTVGKPDTFAVYGIRVVVPPLAITTTTALADASVGVAGENNDQLDDLVNINESMALRFSIGEKRYAEGSLKDFPANTGLGGVAASSVSNTNAAAIFQNRVALYSTGQPYTFGGGKIPVIWNSEPFSVQLFCQWATTPTIVDNKLLFVFLDGVRGRAVQ